MRSERQVRAVFKVSVAMATYNGEKYIESQLRSVLSQIRQPDEVIITDDCSTDNTVEIINRFISENRLTGWSVTVNSQNLGYIKNFKNAISKTTGDIVFLCDQDDVWCEDKIESLDSVFTSSHGVRAVSSAFSVIDGNGNDTVSEQDRNFGLINMRLNKTLQKIPMKVIMHSNISPGCTLAVSRETADIYVKSSPCALPHDYELNLIAAAKDGLYFYNRPLIKYRIHGNNTLGLDGKPQTRTEIAREKLNAAEAVMNAGGGADIFDVCEKRLNALENRDKKEILKLNRKAAYRRLYSIKERAGDILFVLGRD